MANGEVSSLRIWQAAGNPVGEAFPSLCLPSTKIRFKLAHLTKKVILSRGRQSCMRISRAYNAKLEWIYPELSS